MTALRATTGWAARAAGSDSASPLACSMLATKALTPGARLDETLRKLRELPIGEVECRPHVPRQPVVLTIGLKRALRGLQPARADPRAARSSGSSPDRPIADGSPRPGPHRPRRMPRPPRLPAPHPDPREGELDDLRVRDRLHRQMVPEPLYHGPARLLVGESDGCLGEDVPSGQSEQSGRASQA